MQPGALIAERYRLERLLGKGGMGAVWAATHTVTGKAVALKLLRPRDDDDGAARRRMLREARAACAVQHPSVVAVHDVVAADDGAPVLVMDLLEGESLRARLDRERTLPADEALRLGERVLAALEVAHAAGIVHRDLKPDNLFLETGGDLRILDFGVAKLLGSEGFTGASGTLTAADAMVGTPRYMAPEQAFGEPVDGRADLWAVGVIVYECLAGEPPTRGDNLGQVLKLLSTGRLEPLRARVPELPPPIAAAVDALLAIEVDARPASARAALDLFASARRSEALPATSTALATRTVEGEAAPEARQRPIRRIAALATVIVAALVVALSAKRAPDAHVAAAPSALAPLPLAPASVITPASEIPPLASAEAPPSRAATPSPPTTAASSARPPRSAAAAASASPPSAAASALPAPPIASSATPSTPLLTEVPF